MKTLRDVPVGAKPGEADSRRRTSPPPHYGYGHHQGTEVYVRKVAPLGDPVELTVRGYELSIRKNEAEAVEVEP